VHELSIMSGVVDVVIERAEGAKIALVRLEIGQLAGVAADALAYCFEICADGTPLAGAALDIISIEGRARCAACGIDHAQPWLGAPCACGSFDQVVTAGTELRLKEVEVI
jgi:hydrogenase nickel incorporation protein HypA/HybF